MADQELRSAKGHRHLGALALAVASAFLGACSKEEGAETGESALATEFASAAEAASTTQAVSTSVCDRVLGRWSAEVNAFTSKYSGGGSKMLIVERRTLKLHTTKADGTINGDSWTGWNTRSPTDEGGECVFITREAIAGNGFGFRNPYAVVKKIRLKPDADGIELAIEADDFADVPCDEELDNLKYSSMKCSKDGKHMPATVATVNGWLKSLDGSFWRAAAEPAAEPARPAAKPARPRQSSSDENDGFSCLAKCSATQNACVVRCNNKDSCILECAAKGQECLGRCI